MTSTMDIDKNKIIFKGINDKKQSIDIVFPYGKYTFNQSIRDTYNVEMITLVKLSPKTSLHLEKNNGATKIINNPYI